MRFSKLISLFLHPLFMPIFVIFLSIQYVEHIHFIFSSSPYAHYIYLATLVFTFILPLLTFFYFLRVKKIDSFEMTSKEERDKPLLATIIIILIGSPVFFAASKLMPVLSIIYISSLIILIVAYLVTKFWKISLHMLSIGGASGTLIALNYMYGGVYYLTISFILLSGLLGYARLAEDAHTPSQVYVGYILGFVIQINCVINYNLITSTISIFLSSIASMLYTDCFLSLGLSLTF